MCVPGRLLVQHFVLSQSAPSLGLLLSASGASGLYKRAPSGFESERGSERSRRDCLVKSYPLRTSTMESVTTEIIDSSIPVTSEGDPIEWDGNLATILGTVAQVDEWQTRTGKFTLLVQHHAVITSNGNIAVESIQSIPFLANTFDDPRTTSSPCPRTAAARIVEYNTRVAALAVPGPAFAPLAAMPAGPGYILNAYLVKDKDAKYLEMWHHVVKKAPSAAAMLRAANGSGLDFVVAFIAQANNASGRDQALIAAQYSSLANGGVKTELSFESFNEKYLKNWRIALRNLGRIGLRGSLVCRPRPVGGRGSTSRARGDACRLIKAARGATSCCR